jgi:hypothetical protein
MKARALPGFDAYVDAGAEFEGPERRYRFRLWRFWGTGERFAVWIMLNPSTADEHALDQTLRKVEAFCRAWGYDGFVVVNLFALRSVHPDDLYRMGDRATESVDRNTLTIISAAKGAALVVVGWGTEQIAQQPAQALATHFVNAGIRPMCLGVNKDGSPKHPLYLPYSTPLQLWKAA